MSSRSVFLVVGWRGVDTSPIHFLSLIIVRHSCVIVGILLELLELVQQQQVGHIPAFLDGNAQDGNPQTSERSSKFSSYFTTASFYVLKTILTLLISYRFRHFQLQEEASPGQMPVVTENEVIVIH